MRAPLKTKIKDIVAYWAVRVDECDLSVDFSEAHEMCWRCGYKARLHRCHIVPDSLGGKDVPENLVLLCKRCHEEGPNINDPDFMWDWLKAHKATFYNTYWVERGMKEYEFIYGESPTQVMVDLGVTMEEMEVFIKAYFKNHVSWHFGEPRSNPATVAGILRALIKERRVADRG